MTRLNASVSCQLQDGEVLSSSFAHGAWSWTGSRWTYALIDQAEDFIVVHMRGFGTAL